MTRATGVSGGSTLRCVALALCSAAVVGIMCAEARADLPRLGVSPDRQYFARAGSGYPKASPPRVRLTGYNYDHDGSLRLLEDFWIDEWPRVVADFEAMRAAGANVVRVHLQIGRFLRGPAEPDPAALERLAALLSLAERLGLYVDVTGLGAYRRADVPPWYDALDEEGRWEAQAVFWRAVAAVGARSSAVFCYDLMNEPVVPAAAVPDGNWLPGEPFGGMQYVQYVTLDPAGRPPVEVARAWIRRMVRAVREEDRRALVTVGLVPWSLERPGLSSGFVPRRVAAELDFVSVHVYPAAGRLDEALATLRGFAVGAPLLVEEAFPLFASVEELEQLRDAAGDLVAGWIGFYRPPSVWPLPRAAARERLRSTPPTGKVGE